MPRRIKEEGNPLALGLSALAKDDLANQVEIASFRASLIFDPQIPKASQRRALDTTLSRLGQDAPPLAHAFRVHTARARITPAPEIIRDSIIVASAVAVLALNHEALREVWLAEPVELIGSYLPEAVEINEDSRERRKAAGEKLMEKSLPLGHLFKTLQQYTWDSADISAGVDITKEEQLSSAAAGQMGALPFPLAVGLAAGIEF